LFVGFWTILGVAQEDVFKPGDLLYQDDFSDSSSGWSIGKSSEHEYAYANGEYSITARKRAWKYWAWAPRASFLLTDFLVEVEANPTSGSSGHYGIIWGKDNDNYYVFRVDATGRYKLSKKKDDVWQTAPVKWTSHSVISQGTGRNRLKVMVRDDSITLMVNDVVLSTVSASSFDKGRIGLYAGTFNTPDTFCNAHFDNFRVYAAPANLPPTARFTFSPSSPKVGESVRFDASPSIELDGLITNYKWTFGDGNSGAGRIVTHTYSRNGSFTIRLTVTDNNGASASFSQRIEVVSRPPQADFSFTPSEPSILDEVHFRDRSTDPDGDIVSWHWDFGNGDTSTKQNPIHHYTRGGTFTVILAVTDNDGLTDETSQTIVVEHKDLIQADFTFQVVDEKLHKVHLDASASIDTMGTIVRYEWDWDGDGVYDTAVQTPAMIHRFEGEGPYQVILAIVDDQGNRASCTKEVSL
jgi:PKD repeat protein